VRRFDRYILREHNGPFWFALVVITLVLVIDFVPDVVSMVISKGLATSVIIQVFVLNLSWMLALSVPMAVLSGTLMAFGRLSSDSEILAMKASGVSLYRIIAPILLLSAVLGTALVEFNNEVLPDANHQARLLMSDIRRKRPTLDLKPNVMEDRIPGYHLLIKSMDQKTSAIAGVTIFDQKDQGAPRTVVAKTGVMNYSADGRTLILRLSDGEIHEVDPADPRKYRRTAFQQQVFYLGGVEDEWSRTSSDYRTDREKSSAQMREDIAAWRQAIVPHRGEINRVCSTMVSALLLTAPATAVSDVSLPLADVTFQPSGDITHSARGSRHQQPGAPDQPVSH
jgi:lipopolysaccharide export system permease protein